MRFKKGLVYFMILLLLIPTNIFTGKVGDKTVSAAMQGDFEVHTYNGYVGVIIGFANGVYKKQIDIDGKFGGSFNYSHINEVAFSNEDLEIVELSAIGIIGKDAFRGNNIKEFIVKTDTTIIEGEILGGNQSNPKNLKIIGHKGSDAERYANEYVHTFEDINGEVVLERLTEPGYAKKHRVRITVKGQDSSEPIKYAFGPNPMNVTGGYTEIENGSVVEFGSEHKNYIGEVYNYAIQVKGINYLGIPINYEEDPRGFGIDITPPTVSISTNGNSTYKKSHSTKITATDALSGLDKVEYQWTTGSTFPTGGTFTNTSNGATINTPSGVTGNRYLHIRATDKAGNERKFSSNVFRLDNTAPTLTITQTPTGPTNGSVTITAKGTDSHSGVNGVGMSMGDITEQKDVYTTTVTENGEYLFMAVDNAGNMSTKSITVNNIDTTAPNNPTISGSTEWRNSNQSVTITHGTDSGSGVDRTQYRLDNGTWTNYSSAITISKEGSTKVDARTYDKAGNVSGIATKTFKIDKTAPVISLGTNGGAWATSHSTKVNISDTGGSALKGAKYRWTTSSTFPTSGTFTSVSNGATLSAPTSTGNHYLHVEAEDNAGNKRTFTSNVFRVDRTAPTVPSIGGSESWSKSNQSISITPGTDGHSGVARTEYRIDGGAWTTYSSAISITKEGSTKVEARTVDKLGNISSIATKTFRIDKTAPTHVSSVVEGQRYTSGTNYWVQPGDILDVTFRQRDTGSGNDLGYIRLNGSSQDVRYNHKYNGTTTNMAAVNSSFVNTSSVRVESVSRTEHNTSNGYGTLKWKVKANTDGHNLALQYYYRDIAENNLGYTTVGNIRVDGTAPTTPVVNANTGWQNSNQSVTVTPGTDSGSGVARTEYRIDNGSWTTYSSAISVTKAGSTKIDARTIDRVGNISSIATKTITIDKTAPTVPGIGGSTDWRNSNQSITITPGTDSGGSGVKSTQYRIDNGAWATYSSAITISKEGNTKVDAKTIDNAGNESSVTTKTFKIDKTVPLLELLQSPTGHTNGNVTITAEGTDSLSGVKRVRQAAGSWTNSDKMTHIVTTNGTYNFEVEDNAGNTTTKSIKVSNIDKTNPTIILSKNGGGYATSHTTTVTGTDTGSGLDRLEYAWTTGVNFPVSGFTTVTSGSSVNTPTSTGEHYLHVRATDKAGNVQQVTSNVFKVDRTKPTKPSISAPTEWQKGNVTVTITGGTDAHSGVDKTEYRLNGGTWNTYTSPIVVSSNGETTIETRTLDKAGNISDVTSQIVKVDKVVPSMTITSSTTSKTHEDVILTVKGTDNHSGVKRIKLPSGSWVNGDNTTYTAKYNGDYEFVVEDNAGNTATNKVTVNNIDKTSSFDKPSISGISDVTLGEGNKVVTSDVTSLKVKDWRDTGNEWRVSVTAEQFKLEGESFYLPKGTVVLNALSGITRVDGSGAMPVSNLTSKEAIDMGTVTLATSVSSRGEYDVNFPNNALEISVEPTTAKVGKYKSKISWDYITAP